MSDVTRRPRGHLSRDEILGVALDVVNSDGVDSLTMRRIANELGVNPMTIYLRFENKDALVAAIISQRLAGVGVAHCEGSIEDRLVAWSRSIYDQLSCVGDLLPVLGRADLSQVMLDSTEAGLALLNEAGLHGQGAVDTFRSLFWHSIGFAALGSSLHAHAPELLRESPVTDESHPHLMAAAPHLDEFQPDELFERTTRALVQGLIDSPQRRQHGHDD